MSMRFIHCSYAAAIMEFMMIKNDLDHKVFELLRSCSVS